VKKQKPPWIATVLIESNEQYGHTDNKQRLKLLLKILKETSSQNQGSGIILFPAGYFQTSRFKPSARYHQFVNPIKRALKKTRNRRIVVVFGVDGRNASKRRFPIFKDQIALAVDQNGIATEARKYHPTTGEKSTAVVAKNYLVKENGKPRTLELNGKRFYLAVCYDLYGIRQRSLQNPGVDGVLNLIHQFTARCQCETEICKCGSASGDVYWAKNGMVGASMKWNCPIYGSVVFFNRKIPERWPSGVLVKGSVKNTKTWRYEENQIRLSKGTFSVHLDEIISMRIFHSS